VAGGARAVRGGLAAARAALLVPRLATRRKRGLGHSSGSKWAGRRLLEVRADGHP
jgi:hypothetical protein